MDCLIVHPMSVLFAMIGKHGVTLTIHVGGIMDSYVNCLQSSI